MKNSSESSTISSKEEVIQTLIDMWDTIEKEILLGLFTTGKIVEQLMESHLRLMENRPEYS